MSTLKKVASLATFANGLIDRIFQLDRLDALARNSAIVRVAHAELIMLSNYIILSKSPIVLQQFEVFGFVIAAETFPPTFDGKIDALAKAFAHVAGKLDDAISTQNLARVLAELDFIGDIVKAAVPTTRTIIHKKA